MRHHLLYAAIALATASAAAQPATLSGFVVDSETDEAVAGANVYSEGVGTVTNRFGFFRLVLEPGSIDLHVSHVGYETRRLHITIDGETRLSVEIDPVAIGLDEVEVVGEREGTDRRMSTISVPIEEVERLPAFLGEIDVIKTLQLLPGVQSGNEGSTGLYVRGGGPDQNLILLDGAPIYNASHIFGFLSVFNSNALQDVKLVKGGFPARYGGRLSSVVDLSMKEGSRKGYGVDGTVGLVFSSLTAEGPIMDGRGSFIVSARRTYIDVLARPFMHHWLADGEELAAYFYDGSAKLSLQASGRSRLYYSLFLGRDVYGSTVESAAGDFTERNTAEADWGNVASTIRWSYLPSPKLFSSASLTYSRYRFDVLQRLTQISEEETSKQIAYSSGISDWTAALEIDYRPSPHHNMLFGGNLTRHAFNPGVTGLSLSGVDSTLTPDSFPFSGLEAYAFAEDELDIGSRLQANVGLHASAMHVRGVSYTSLQPRISARFLLGPLWSLRASYSTMRQYLQLLTNSGLNLPTDLWVAATDRIRPQDAWQTAAGIDYERGAFSVSLEAYYKSMRGLIEYEAGAAFVSPNEDWQEKVEVGRGWSYGVELFLRKASGRTTGWVGYTLSWSERKFDGINGGVTFPYRYDRRHDVSLVLAHRLSSRLDVGATWVYGTGQAVTLATARFHDGRVFDANNLTGAMLRQYGPRGGYRMAPYHRLDLAVNWQAGKVPFLRKGESTLSFGAYNVYNRRNPFFLFEARRPDGSRAYNQASLFPVVPFVAYRFSF